MAAEADTYKLSALWHIGSIYVVSIYGKIQFRIISGQKSKYSTSKFWGKFDIDGKLNERFIYKKQTLWKRLDDTNHLKWR